MRLTATDKKNGSYVDSLCTDVKQNALDFYNDFSPTCDIKQKGELSSLTTQTLTQEEVIKLEELKQWLIDNDYSTGSDKKINDIEKLLAQVTN